MSRLFLRRGRILPGPLKALQPAERRSPVPVTALALTSAALAAGLLLMPHLSPGLSVDPTPMVDFAEAVSAEPVSVAYAEPEPLLTAATPVSAEPVATPVASAASEPARPAAPASAAKVAAAPAKPVADASLFQLDLLPVLRADGADLDPGAAPDLVPQRAAPKTGSRRSAATRGAVAAASGGPVQH